MENEKKQFRELKREMKRVGKRKMRSYLKKQLAENPDDAPFAELDYGKWSTEGMNGKFPDSKRKKDDERSNCEDTGGEHVGGAED